MATENLEIIISAETEKASAGIANVTKSLSTLDKAAVTSSKAVTQLNKATGNAVPTLTNFGRVIQDAPFGIIGIANNIDPLITSFQSLQKQTGSSKEAFKQLGASLMGPAGIAIGISAVTSLLIAFGPKIMDAIAGVSAFDKALKEAGEKGGEAFVSAQIKVDGFLQTLNSATATAHQQNQALKGLNGLLNEYGLEVDTIAEAQRVGSEIGTRYATIKQLEARATALAATAAQEYAKTIANQSAVTEEVSALTGSTTDKILFFVRNAATGFTSLGKAVSTVTKSENLQKGFTDEIAKTNAEIQKELAALEGMAEVTVKTTKAKKEQSQARKQEEIEIIKVTHATQGLISANQALLDLSRLATKESAKSQAKSLSDKLKALQGEGEKPISTEGKQPAGAAIAALIPTEQQMQQLTAFQAAFTIFKANAKEIVESGVGSLIDGIFTTLENGGNIFENLAQSVKQFVLQLIKAVVQAIALNAILKALDLGTGGAGGVSGLLGGLFGGRAAGGPVQAGQSYIVGETGAERFVPAVNGAIVPDMGTGGGGQFEFVISGNTLRAIQRRADTSFGRLNG